MAKMDLERANRQEYVREHGSVSAYADLSLPRSLQKGKPIGLTSDAAKLLSEEALSAPHAREAVVVTIGIGQAGLHDR